MVTIVHGSVKNGPIVMITIDHVFLCPVTIVLVIEPITIVTSLFTILGYSAGAGNQSYYSNYQQSSQQQQAAAAAAAAAYGSNYGELLFIDHYGDLTIGTCSYIFWIKCMFLYWRVLFLVILYVELFSDSSQYHSY